MKTAYITSTYNSLSTFIHGGVTLHRPNNDATLARGAHELDNYAHRSVVLGTVALMLGLVLMALPVTIIVAKFSDEYERSKT